MYVLCKCINFYFIDDHCQYWLNKTDGTLTSPNFGATAIANYELYDYGPGYKVYDHNLNCTWILNADQGYYIILEIDYFKVNNNNDTSNI